jgi:tetratricopeptide (TPR) repeat protein
VLALTAALSDPRHLGLRYRWAATADAQRTIAAGYGNCLSLSSVVVGAARTLGLRAYYVDVEGVPMRYRAQRFSISAGHIAALVHTERGNVIVDTFPRSSAEMRYRRLDDLQALAHFYNNRAYERMHEAQEKGDPIPWKEVWRNFELATRVDPELADAWNNLGIAYAHLGSLSGAESCYRAAIRIDPRLTSAYLNLAGVLLRRGEREAALRNLRAAEKLDPDNPSIDYGRCLVRASRRMAEAAAASHACEGLLNESARPLAVR